MIHIDRTKTFVSSSIKVNAPHAHTVGRLGKMSRLSSRAVTQFNDETQCNNNNIYPSILVRASCN